MKLLNIEELEIYRQSPFYEKTKKLMELTLSLFVKENSIRFNYRVVINNFIYIFSMNHMRTFLSIEIHDAFRSKRPTLIYDFGIYVPNSIDCDNFKIAYEKIKDIYINKERVIEIAEVLQRVMDNIQEQIDAVDSESEIFKQTLEIAMEVI